MLRTSLRSITDPLRQHVCLSCLTRRFGGNVRVRQLHATSALRNESGDGPPVNASIQIPEPATGSASPEEVKPTSGENNDPPTESRKKKRNDYNIKAKRVAQDAQKKNAADKKRAGATKKKGDKPKQKVSQQELAEFLKNKAQKSKGESAILQQLGSSQKSEKTSTRSDQESMKNMAFILDNMHKKDIGSIKKAELNLKPLDVETAPVPRLSFGLERVLFNPGVYHLRDPRSNVFNFDPYLGSIMRVTEFDFNALKEYIASSKDDLLRGIAQKEKKKYVGSSSSMTSVLSQFHYLLSAWRGIDTRNISQGFPDKLRTFTRLLRAPSAMFLRYQDGVYAIDADKEFDSANILMNLGKSMEKLLTLPKEEFERYRRTSENKVTPEEEQAMPESYHYSTIGDFIMRSQLDAYDPRLPGTGMFDLKTRAVVSIRMDAQNFEHGLGYQIKGQYGAFESYEREYFDMIRAAFLKYSLQVRIGRMDGIFVAFHNIERIFGFQYVSLPEMDQTLHGTADTTLGDTEFQLSLGLWNKVLDKATAKYPERSLRFHFETRDASTPFMYIFAEPVTDEEITSIQTKNAEEINAYQQRILNLATEEPKESEGPKEDDAQAPTSSESPASTNGETESAQVSTETSGDAHTIDQPQPDSPTSGESPANTNGETESAQVSTETSGDAHTTDQPQPDSPTANKVYDSEAPPDDSLLSELDEEAEAQGQPEGGPELLAMSLMIKNKVNGKHAQRPSNLSPTDEWTVDYELIELPSLQAQALYNACQRRRKVALMGRGEDETDVAANVYIRKLREISNQGRQYRNKQDKMDKEKGVVVLGDE